MDFFVSLNLSATDKRIAILAKLCKEHGFEVADYTQPPPKGKKGICFVLPRTEITARTFENLPAGSYVFGFPKQIAVNEGLKYVCLSDDETFIQQSNYLTALAMKEILLQTFGSSNQKILIMGWGKLTAQLEKVLAEADMHILNFNHHKVQELTGKYGQKAFFEKADLSQFPVIINTIPKQVIGETEIRKILRKDITIFDVASAPFGFDFGKVDAAKLGTGQYKLKYKIEPHLPGRFFPNEAARAIFDWILRFIDKESARPTIVLCITGSSCSYLKLMPVLRDLAEKYDMIPVLSDNANKPNRFVDIEVFKHDLREICGNNIITTIAGAETLSSNKRILASVVFPATGNTMAKLAQGVTDTCVTMAVKALLRNTKPCIIGLSTNDALSGNAATIGTLLNRKNYYFVPFSQDDPQNKPFSMICDFSKVGETIEKALQGKQIQPIVN